MKVLYKTKKLEKLLEEYPLIYINCSEKNENNVIIKNNIKNIKFKNSLLKKYNKNLFNGTVLLLYGNEVQKFLKELNNIIGIFFKSNNINYFITLKKFLQILIYFKSNLKYINILNILEGPSYWFILKL
jgi:hypothetical protein